MFSVANLDTTESKSEIFRELDFFTVNEDFAKVGDIDFDIHLLVVDYSTGHTRRNARLNSTIFAHLLLDFENSVRRPRYSVDARFLNMEKLAIIVGYVRIAGSYAIPFAWIRCFFREELFSGKSAFLGNSFAFSDAHILDTTVINVRFI